MEKVFINNFVKFVPGINQSRVEKYDLDEKDEFYDQTSFEFDFLHIDLDYCENSMNNNADGATNIYLNAGDVVISNSMQLATTVSPNNSGKVLSINFTKVEFTSNRLNKGYFIYLFNAFKSIKRQKEREAQGSGLIQRITLNSLGQIKFPYVPIQEQVQIGTIYIEMLMMKNKFNKYSLLLEQLTYTVLEERLKEER